MPIDKYTATWVSHSSINDFLKCPRAYYLNNVYKDPKTGHKISITSPAMSLGSAVHDVLESLSNIPTAVRFKEPMMEKFTTAWKKFAGKKGGFTSTDQESDYRNRGEEMIKNVAKDPGPLARLSVKINQDLPHFWLSPDDNIILCGKIDWLEYFPDTNAVGIIDFKTGKNKEDEGSLQLPIYSLLVHNCQKRQANSAKYWYLAESNDLIDKSLPNLEESHEKILNIAKRIKLARKLEQFKCPNGEKGCYACRPFEAVIRGDAEFVGLNNYGQDLYLVDKEAMAEDTQDSSIL